jgi:8-oxo-dGTP diphosphatase
MNRRYPDRPLVGVGAIIFRGDCVILVKRGKEPSLGKWSIPGGLVELGETLHDAVRREVREEVGLDVEVGDLVAALDRVILDQAGKIEYHYILLDFVCDGKEGTPSPSSDALDCAFVSLDVLGDYPMTDGTENVIRRAYSRTRGDRGDIYGPES